jgi:UPF0716 protein FxsA
MRLALLLAILVPAVELGLLILAGRAIGGLAVLAVILGTALVGALVARRQGLDALRRLREEAVTGQPPGDTLVDGLLVLAAGFLLIMPGLVSDLLGALLLVPAIRQAVRGRVVAYLERSMRDHAMSVISSRFSFPSGPAGEARPAPGPGAGPRRVFDMPGSPPDDPRAD